VASDGWTTLLDDVAIYWGAAQAPSPSSSR